MRAVLLGPYPLERQVFMGGVDAVITNLAEGLSSLGGLDLHVVVANAAVEEERVVRDGGMTIHYLPQTKRLAALTMSWQDVRRIRAKLDAIQPDVVDAQGTNFYAGAAVSSPYPSIVTIHGIMRKDESIHPGLSSRLKSRLVGYYEKRCVARAKDIVCISAYVDEEFRWSKGARIHRLENPVPARYYAISDEEIPNTVLLAGRIIRRKGILELVDAVAKIRERIPDVRVRVAGEAQAEPDYGELVKQSIARQNLEKNVELIGLLDEQSIIAEYSRCCLVVLPSRQETSPMAVQQAMAAGKAVVATRVGGLPYLVDHGKTGLLVDFGDREALAEAMVELLLDRERRRAMGRRAREVAGRFQCDKIAQETYRVFQLVASDRR